VTDIRRDRRRDLAVAREMTAAGET